MMRANGFADLNLCGRLLPRDTAGMPHSRSHLGRLYNATPGAASTSGYMPDDDARSSTEHLQQMTEPLTAAEVLPAGESPVGLGGRVKRFFLGDKLDKEKLKALGACSSSIAHSKIALCPTVQGMCQTCDSHRKYPPADDAGLGAVASYGFVSNLTYGAGLAVAWIAFVRRMARAR